MTEYYVIITKKVIGTISQEQINDCKNNTPAGMIVSFLGKASNDMTDEDYATYLMYEHEIGTNQKHVFLSKSVSRLEGDEKTAQTKGHFLVNHIHRLAEYPEWDDSLVALENKKLQSCFVEQTIMTMTNEEFDRLLRIWEYENKKGRFEVS